MFNSNPLLLILLVNTGNTTISETLTIFKIIINVYSVFIFVCFFTSTSGTVKPVNWHRPVYELDTDPENNGFINEDFIVWMRTAALPTFRKLYRIIQKKNNMAPTLPRGNYTLVVDYSILNVKVVTAKLHEKNRNRFL